jgi:hypothetical protein
MLCAPLASSLFEHDGARLRPAGIAKEGLCGLFRVRISLQRVVLATGVRDRP